MATAKKRPQQKKPTAKKKTPKKSASKSASVSNVSTSQVVAPVEQEMPLLKQKRSIWLRLKSATNRYLARRPHRSFRLTRRRDYRRSLVLPGYFRFNVEVSKTLWKNKKTFFGLAAVYAIFSALLVGITSQSTYNNIGTTLDATSNGIFNGAVGAVGRASLILATTLSSNVSQSVTATQVTYAVLVALLAWLATVWLLRNLLGGYKVKLRDGLYTSGSPIIATFIVLIVLVVQLLPLALAVIAFVSASLTHLLDNGVEALLFWVFDGLLILLSVYWITSTIFALIIVTLPGMYPFRALRAAGDLVIGRRLRLITRIIAMLITVALAWLIILVPVILIQSGLQNLSSVVSNIPIVPIALLAMTSLSLVWIASYMYVLYRKVVDDDASPA